MTVSDAESGGGGGTQDGMVVGQNSKASPSTSNGSSPFYNSSHGHASYLESSKLRVDGGGPSLTADEEASLRLFLSHVNSWRGARGYPSLSESAAIKFLMARKFQVRMKQNSLNLIWFRFVFCL